MGDGSCWTKHKNVSNGHRTASTSVYDCSTRVCVFFFTLSLRFFHRFLYGYGRITREAAEVLLAKDRGNRQWMGKEEGGGRKKARKSNVRSRLTASVCATRERKNNGRYTIAEGLSEKEIYIYIYI
uniref:Uncharacterized protein n=1 Tax=Glypta fumiferanae TaxID=389681 RepID=A0A0F6Q8X3_9HYME|nr:hypothetical protein [Glypta fumiferanae]